MKKVTQVMRIVAAVVGCGLINLAYYLPNNGQTPDEYFYPVLVVVFGGCILMFLAVYPRKES